MKTVFLRRIHRIKLIDLHKVQTPHVRPNPSIDPRTVAVRKGIQGPIKTPEQMRGIKFRVPNSKILQRAYRLLGANPIPVPWVEAAAAIKTGYADALDPSVEALFVFGFNFFYSSNH